MSANHLLDEVSARLNLKNDAALCRTLNTAAPNISKIRSGKIVVGPSYILRIHELSPEQFPVRFIRDLLALEAQ